LTFRIHALAYDAFAPLFDLAADELAGRRAAIVVAEESPGYPCRVSLADARIGERVLLVNHEHLPANSPYRSCHAIFVREHARQASPAPGTVPEAIARRLISARAFDGKDFMVTAEVCDGIRLDEVIPQMFADERVAYLHLHHARQGCYAARVTRA